MVTADLRADGAYVHLIDTVLTPPEEQQKPAEPAALPLLPSAGAGTGAAQLVGVLRQPQPERAQWSLKAAGPARSPQPHPALPLQPWPAAAAGPVRHQGGRWRVLLHRLAGPVGTAQPGARGVLALDGWIRATVKAPGTYEGQAYIDTSRSTLALGLDASGAKATNYRFATFDPVTLRIDPATDGSGSGGNSGGGSGGGSGGSSGGSSGSGGGNSGSGGGSDPGTALADASAPAWQAALARPLWMPGSAAGLPLGVHPALSGCLSQLAEELSPADTPGSGRLPPLIEQAQRMAAQRVSASWVGSAGKLHMPDVMQPSVVDTRRGSAAAVMSAWS